MAYYSTTTLWPNEFGPGYQVYGPGDLVAGEPVTDEALATVWVEVLAEREAEIGRVLEEDAQGGPAQAERIWEEVEAEARRRASGDR